MKSIKIAYIGGGSKMWARVFQNDLALACGLSGEIALYDIDIEAAIRNQLIGERIERDPNCVSHWDYRVYQDLDSALRKADFVIISILPGTFTEMQSDVHASEKYGIWQSVGDTVGPGGVLRAMRTVPIYETFARKIKEICPSAWIINFTNPMSICTKTLYDVFPSIKAFGCCHEVFHAQEFLCAVIHEMLGIDRPSRKEINTDVSGINHFTWITKAQYQNVDILALLPSFIDRFYEQGYSEYEDHEAWKNDYFSCGNKVKEDLFLRYGALGAAGDRHLSEFMNNCWYLGSPEAVRKWQFSLTPVSFRINQMQDRIQESIDLAEGRKPVRLQKSQEEAVDLIMAILGLGTITSNVNLPNKGQMQGFPLGSVVETNCIFSLDSVEPMKANPLPLAVHNLVLRNCLNIDELYNGIKERNLDRVFAAFVNQPLCSVLSVEDARQLFKEMMINTRKYLDQSFGLDSWINKYSLKSLK
jgi:alpha-galactosidase